MNASLTSTSISFEFISTIFAIPVRVKPPLAVSSVRFLLASYRHSFARCRVLLGSERLRPAIPAHDATRFPHFSVVPENQRPVLLLRSDLLSRNPARGSR